MQALNYSMIIISGCNLEKNKKQKLIHFKKWYITCLQDNSIMGASTYVFLSNSLFIYGENIVYSTLDS